MCNYILEDGVPKLEPDAVKWWDWFKVIENRRIVDTQVTPTVHVSTVFVGVDQDFGASELPVLWETMVFGGKLDEEMDRYTSLEDAKAGHEAMVARVREAETLEESDARRTD